LSPEREAAIARVTARLLEVGLAALIGSAALTLVALVVLASGPPGPRVGWTWWLIALLGVPALWIGLQIRFDARLFADLARSPWRDDETMAERLASLDEALAALGLVRAPDHGAPRSMAERVRGARALLLRQIAVLALQLALALAVSCPAARGGQ
jgi:hypothetical protein